MSPFQRDWLKNIIVGGHGFKGLICGFLSSVRSLYYLWLVVHLGVLFTVTVTIDYTLTEIMNQEHLVQLIVDN